MNCKSSNEYMMKYLDGNLNDIEHAQMKQHLKGCKACSDEFKDLDEIFSFLETTSIVEPPEDFEVNVMKKVNRLEAERKRKTSMGLVFLYHFTAVISFVLLIVFAIGLKEVSIIKVVEQVSGYFTSFSSMLSALYNAAEQIYNVASDIVSVLIQVTVAIFKTYYYVFITLLAMLLAVQKVFLILVKQDGGDK